MMDHCGHKTFFLCRSKVYTAFSTCNFVCRKLVKFLCADFTSFLQTKSSQVFCTKNYQYTDYEFYPVELQVQFFYISSQENDLVKKAERLLPNEQFPYFSTRFSSSLNYFGGFTNVVLLLKLLGRQNFLKSQKVWVRNFV